MQRIYVTIRPLNREDSVLYFPPEAFGPFRVLHQIGAGTLGPVFRAYEPGRDRLVAIKVFRLDLTPEQAAALVTGLETLVAGHINHPNIAAPIAAGLEHGAAYLAQEYAIGDSLDIVLRERGPMPIRDVVALVESLAGAIDYAAGRGVHHGLLHMRDIVLAADSARITGFGVAAALARIGAKLPTRPAFALNGQIASAGKPAERDVHSLGAIAFEAATGKRASADNLNDFEAEHGAELRGAFDMPLAANPEMRPPRASDFAAALREAAAEMTADATAGLKASTTKTASTTNDTSGATNDTPGATNDTSGATNDTLVTEPVVVPTFRSAVPDAATDDVDLRVDERADLMGLPDEPIDGLIEPSLLPPSPSSWAAQPPRALQATDVEPEPSSRRWQIVGMLLVFAVLAALSVGFFLRSPNPVPVTGKEPGVDSTIVDLPASAPSSPNATAGKPAPVAPVAPSAPNVPIAPSPSRPASGAVGRAQTGSVLIRSTPADADVLVNGNPRGKTPLALRDLALGSYTIRVARDGYATEERTLRLTARRPATSTTINLRPAFAAGAAPASARGAPADKTAGKTARTGPGGLNVQSRPPGARVFVNNRLAGSTPIAVPGLPAGPATVRIELDGYLPWTTTVGISAGEQTRVAASLERK